ncbi:MAG: hypothetical protein M5U19_03245 [Microthrixaceae bacterium]|nr:hypothetical protein [Microthrixaceae bacterium]
MEHPWFEEAGEQLPTHKDPPALGGDHRFRITSGHNRWSIHAMNITNPLLLGTHRGRPFALVNDDDAAELGVEDDGEVRIFNDHGEFHVEVRTSPAQKPGMVTVYNGFEGFHFPEVPDPTRWSPELSSGWASPAATATCAMRRPSGSPSPRTVAYPCRSRPRPRARSRFQRTSASGYREPRSAALVCRAGSAAPGSRSVRLRPPP